MTTAYLVLKLFAPHAHTVVVPFDHIIPQVLAGKYEAGLIIHEGQLTYSKSGLHRIVDFGKWWGDKTGLPLPLGGNAIRRALGAKLMSDVCTALKNSIQYALDHREPDDEDGRKAVEKLLDMGYEAGIIPHEPRVAFVS